MKAFLAAALMLLGASQALAADAPQLAVAQDPLMRQIRRSASRPDGGIASFVAVKGANGEQIVIPMVEGSSGALNGATATGTVSDPLKALNPAAGLVTRKQGGAAGGEAVKTPNKQLRRIEDKKTWR